MLNSPEGRLCLAILLQAINDMTEQTKVGIEARRWVRHMHTTFLLCAEVLEVSEFELRDRLLQIAKQGGLNVRHQYGKHGYKTL